MQQDQHHFQAELPCCAGDLAAPVGLGVRAGDHGIGALRQDVGKQELQLTRLVAAERETGEVIALDPDLHPAKRLAQARAVVQGRRQMGEPHARQGVDARLQRRAAERAIVGHRGHASLPCTIRCSGRVVHRHRAPSAGYPRSSGPVWDLTVT